METESAESGDVRFLTASGRPMKIDPEALKKARQLFAAEDLSRSDSMNALGATLLGVEESMEETAEPESSIHSIENLPTPPIDTPKSAPRRSSAFKPPTMIRQSPSSAGTSSGSPIVGTPSPFGTSRNRGSKTGRGGFQSPLMRNDSFQSPMLNKNGSASNPRYKPPRRSVGSVGEDPDSAGPPAKRSAPESIMGLGPGRNAPLPLNLDSHNSQPDDSSEPNGGNSTEVLQPSSDEEDFGDMEVLNRSASPIL